MNFIEATLIQEGTAYFIDAAGFKVRLPEAFSPKVKPYVGRQVTFGVRPEDVAERTSLSVGVHENTLQARADVVEPLGSETFVYLTCGPHAIVARMESPERPLTVGQTLEVGLKMSKTHLFDKETTQTIV